MKQFLTLWRGIKRVLTRVDLLTAAYFESFAQQPHFEKLCATLNVPVNSENELTHEEDGCHWIQDLFHVVQLIFTDPPRVQWHHMYCIARYQSRFPFCCWQRARLGYRRGGNSDFTTTTTFTEGSQIKESDYSVRGNDVDALIGAVKIYRRMPDEGLHVLAWLNRGEIGAYSPPKLDNLQSMWHYVYEGNSDWSHHKANDSQEHSLFLLIVEYGVHLEDPISKAFGPELNMTARAKGKFQTNSSGCLRTVIVLCLHSEMSCI